MKNKFAKTLLVLFTCSLMGFVSSCSGIKNVVSQKNEKEVNELQLSLQDFDITKFDRTSQIKAEYLLENKGYKDSDEVKAIVELNEQAVIDDYLELSNNEYESVGDYVQEENVAKKIERISKNQVSVQKRLLEKKLIEEVGNNYTTLLNGFSVTTSYGKIKEIEKQKGIKKVILSDTYNQLEAKKEGNDTIDAVTNVVDVYETGIFNSSRVEYNGEGTAVAVLDSGFDCSHEVFLSQPEKQIITPASIDGIIEDSIAYKMTPGLKVSDVYYSKKIPFAYDYADKDPDVTPYDSEHGTHVAGIIGGSSETITGVATHTQLVLMKVFPNLQEGAETADILAALEDAVLLKVDAINMSLGSACGFVREEDGNEINRVYDKIYDSGINLVCAASNDYNSSYGSEQGNNNKVTNPDSATVGSPSTYEASLSVASISGTKSRYIVGNDEQVIFFNEANNTAAKTYDFFEMLGINEDKEYEYVTIPGYGTRLNYANCDVKGKIALVKRGDNTFEEKAKVAKAAGAAGIIIYNNVSGDIIMSMGKSLDIPTISISKDDGMKLAQKNQGTLFFSNKNLAGPFMSDFSSWGPTPNLELKPEITAHGGNILSAIPGGGYDKLSGTSMASPNMCGIVVLIRQYVKDNYPGLSAKEISVMVNQLLMSTATIALNQEGVPYSPRKQGAGLANLENAVSTRAYCTVDGIERSKIELGDDPKKTGEYELKFNIKNISDQPITYNLDIIAMTESVSTSDKDFIAEKDQYLRGDYEVKVETGGTQNNKEVTVPGNKECKVTLTYKLSQEDKTLIDSLFPYGMYVEGFVKCEAKESEDKDLSIPFLGFYGDWTKAPMFDKTYYEVESEAHDVSIDDEDKLKADVFATTPYGSYYYNYIIPLGTYLYDLDESMYDAIPASEDHIAIGSKLGSVDGINTVYAGLLRGAKEMHFDIVDKTTGKVIYSNVDYNAFKSHSGGGSSIPYFYNLDISSESLNLRNNSVYEFKMQGILDYGNGGVDTNVRNSFSFDFTFDNEAPVITDASYEIEYDKSLKKNRYYITLSVSDNHYVQSINPIIFSTAEGYSTLLDSPIPVYGGKNQQTNVRFEITNYIDNLYSDVICTSTLCFLVEDYALNSNLYLVQLPGTDGDFKFTEDGTVDGNKITSVSVNVGETLDLTTYLTSTDEKLDEGKEFLKYLDWSSSDESIGIVKEGQLKGLRQGRIEVNVSSPLTGKSTTIIVNVLNKKLEAKKNAVHDNSTCELEDLKFTSYRTLFAFLSSGDTSEIGDTGDVQFFSSKSSISCYPSEKVKIFYDLDPWYIDEDRIELIWSSTNPEIASVDQDGNVTALKKGSATIKLNVKVDGKESNIMASAKINVKSEFVIDEARTLIAYKGFGGDVVIPDDEGILYIGSFAFCLYELDYNIEVDESDYDKNKIPNSNNTVKSVVIPEGVETVNKYAFYNCTALESVTLPTSIKYLREYSFAGDKNLKSINFEKTIAIGQEAFRGCTSLNNIDLSKVYAIGVKSFYGCSSLASIDLTSLRNTGSETFKNCSSLSNVTLNDNTKLSEGMFENCAIEKLEIGINKIPAKCFSNNKNLQKVKFTNDLISIDESAFSGCSKLASVEFIGSVDSIYDQAFKNCTSLVSFALPNNSIYLGSEIFASCTSLETLSFNENTFIASLGNSFLLNSKISKFVVNSSSKYYFSQEDSPYLISSDGKKLILAAPNYNYEENLVIDFSEIGDGAFSGATNLKSVVINAKDALIGKGAFSYCSSLTSVNFNNKGIIISSNAFEGDKALENLINLKAVKKIGSYAFKDCSALLSVTIGDNVIIDDYAFASLKITELTLGENTIINNYAFSSCIRLLNVNMPENGGVEINEGAFYGNTVLRTIDLSKTTNRIGNYAFYKCSALTTLDLANVEYLGDYSFAGCSKVNTINLPKVIEIGHGAFMRTTVLGNGPIITEISLPDTLKVISDEAFMGCYKLTKVTIPSGIEKINNYAFAYCTNLTNVSLPDSVNSIGEYAFYKCGKLKYINLEKIKEIGDYGFASCTSLESVKLNSATTIGDYGFSEAPIKSLNNVSSLTIIGDYCFQSSAFEEVKLNNITSIGEYAFYNNKELKNVVLSNKLVNLEKGAFLNCSLIKEFKYFDDQNKESSDGMVNDYYFIYQGAIYNYLDSGKIQLNSYPGGKSSQTLEVKEGTYRIEYFAGNSNIYVTKIILPDSLKSIGNFAFSGYASLKEVEFKSVYAPTLEGSNDKSKLSPSDPGYDIVHKYYDPYGNDLYYYQFVAQVGKLNQLKLVLPSNSKLSGYQSLAYSLYFGDYTKAPRSTYEARDLDTVNFIDAYEKLPTSLDGVFMSNKKDVENAYTNMNKLKQDLTAYGYSKEEVETMKKFVVDAYNKVKTLVLENASYEVKALQSIIDTLDSEFSSEDIEVLKDLYRRINLLSKEDKAILDLTKYNQVLSSYNDYLLQLEEVTQDAEVIAAKTYNYDGLGVVSFVGALGILCLALRKKYFIF